MSGNKVTADSAAKRPPIQGGEYLFRFFVVAVRAWGTKEVIKDDTDIVSLLRLSIAERIGQDRFDLWFGAGTEFRVEKDVVRVEVDSQFNLDWLRKHFRPVIETVISERMSSATAVEFRLNPALKRTRGNATESSSRPETTTVISRTHGTRVTSTSGEGTRKYASLDSFVVGDCNRVGHMSTRVTLNQLGKVSPLFLHGPTGVGKTHLLEGLIHGVRHGGARKRAIYLTAEQFTSYFLEALHGKGLPSFRRRYRSVDLLVIDDVQFFLGKKATLEELLHTIDSLLREGRQLAFTADRPPSQMVEMGTELIARFSGGLVCGIQPPDFPTRTSVLSQWVAEIGLEIPLNVVDLIADHLTDDMRALRGALNRLIATHHAFGQPITREMAQQTLSDIFSCARRTVMLDDVEKVVCDMFGVPKRELKSNRRFKAVSQPRMLAMWLARKHTRAALSEIGDHFGRRSHSTVVSAQKTVDNWLERRNTMRLANQDCEIGETIRQLEARLRAC